MLNNRCFGTFHHPLVTATQISLAMDSERRDVLIPEVWEIISDRKSTENLVAKIIFFAKEIYQIFFKFVCLKSHFSLVRSLIAFSACSVSNYDKPSMDDPCFLRSFPQKKNSSMEIAIHFFLSGDTGLTTEMLQLIPVFVHLSDVFFQHPWDISELTIAPLVTTVNLWIKMRRKCLADIIKTLCNILLRLTNICRSSNSWKTCLC